MGARSRLHKPLLLTGLHSGPGLENGLWKTKGQWHKLLNPEGLPGHSCLLGSLHTSRWAQDRVPDRSTDGSDVPPPKEHGHICPSYSSGLGTPLRSQVTRQEAHTGEAQRAQRKPV